MDKTLIRTHQTLQKNPAVQTNASIMQCLPGQEMEKGNCEDRFFMPCTHISLAPPGFSAAILLLWGNTNLTSTQITVSLKTQMQMDMTNKSRFVYSLKFKTSGHCKLMSKRISSVFNWSVRRNYQG